MVQQYKVDKYIIELEVVPIDTLYNIPIVENGKVLGRAILTRNVEPNLKNGTFREIVVLTDIIVYDPNDRKKGIGDKLMGFIISSGAFDTIVTGISTEPGRSLCLKWGFKQEEVKNEKFLVWRKENKSEAISRTEQETKE